MLPLTIIIHNKSFNNTITKYNFTKKKNVVKQFAVNYIDKTTEI